MTTVFDHPAYSPDLAPSDFHLSSTCKGSSPGSISIGTTRRANGFPTLAPISGGGFLRHRYTEVCFTAWHVLQFRCFLSGPFTSNPKWNCWNTRRKNQSSRSKTMKFGTNDSNRWNSNELKIQHFMRRFQFGGSSEGSGKIKGSAYIETSRRG
ncbi:hypothetical protein AVEN_192858-1 [Araneus ventricosus]|uniref:Uncharacterized protein n=1 Tax=Araneus ventricosus TaxID=182803 RepID=A0A4Y2SJY1_ARAVE|nr:hypothetical protein AVEN_192858-1 [Araneus ventricosus]